MKLNFLEDEEQIPERIKVYTVKSPEKDKLEVLSKLCAIWEIKVPWFL